MTPEQRFASAIAGLEARLQAFAFAARQASEAAHMLGDTMRLVAGDEGKRAQEIAEAGIARILQQARKSAPPRARR